MFDFFGSAESDEKDKSSDKEADSSLFEFFGGDTKSSEQERSEQSYGSGYQAGKKGGFLDDLAEDFGNAIYPRHMQGPDSAARSAGYSDGADDRISHGSSGGGSRRRSGDPGSDSSSSASDGYALASGSRNSDASGWALVAGWIIGLCFIPFAGPTLGLGTVSSIAEPPQWIDVAAFVWLFVLAVCAGMLTTALLSANLAKMLLIAAVAAFASAPFYAVVHSGGGRFQLTPNSAYIVDHPRVLLSQQPISAALPPGTTIFDDLNGSSVGEAYGIRFEKLDSLGARSAAIFYRTSASRIEYPQGIPREGTLEWWINVQMGYFYHDSQLIMDADGQALIFSTDAHGGDVTWPGAAKLFVSRYGHLSLFIAQHRYNRPPTALLEARHTRFLFNQWHAIGISYGGKGQSIMLDGEVVATAPDRKQTLGAGGNHERPLDVPTIGEGVSHFWARHRYDGGFQGAVARFRASQLQEDWVVAKGIDSKTPVATPVDPQPADSAPGEDIPLGVKAALDRDYPGWAPVHRLDLSLCAARKWDYKYWLVWGDFNDDGEKDYAAAINHAGRSYIIGLFGQGDGFRTGIVEQFAAPDRTWNPLDVARKGLTVPDLREGLDHQLHAQDRLLRADAIVGIACGKASVAYIYTATGLERIFMSD